jgi:hypothetical protein
MFDLIEKVRQKSDRTKKQIAFVGSLLVSGVIFVVWLSVIYPDFIDTQSRIIKVKEGEISPITSFSNSFSEGMTAIREQFDEFKEKIGGSSTTTASYDETTTEQVGSTNSDLLELTP